MHLVDRRKFGCAPWILAALAILFAMVVRSLPGNFGLISLAKVAYHAGITVRRVIYSPPHSHTGFDVQSKPFEEIWDEPKSSNEMFNGDTKIIWAYWDKGWEQMYPMWKYFVKSWRVRNPTWKVIILDNNNYRKYVSVQDLPGTFHGLRVQHKSDLLRVAVLIRYGGVYLDASTLIFKGFDGIWDTVEDDKLMLTSVGYLPESKLDIFNNALLMTKGVDNTVLKRWQQMMLKHTETPSLSLEEMKSSPIFSRVAKHWDHSIIQSSAIRKMIPYMHNLWMLADIIWNDDCIAGHVLHLPKLRWGFWFRSIPYLNSEARKQRDINPDTLDIDPANDPEMMAQKPFELLKGVIVSAPLAFQEDFDLANRILANTVALKFSSTELDFFNVLIDALGLTSNTAGHIYRAATNTTLYPIEQATLDGARMPSSARSCV